MPTNENNPMSAPVAIDSRQFRSALGAFTTGVTIVTTVDANGNDIGLTANSFNSVSLDPPLVLWSLANTSLSMPAFMNAEHFAVHILAADQQSLSDRFAKRGVDKFAGLELERGPGGIPLLDGCTARFQCRTAFRYAGGDHEIFVGEVVAFDHSDKRPLVFQGGGYGTLFKSEKAPAPVVDATEGSFNKDYLGYLLGSVFHQLEAQIKPQLAQRDISQEEYWILTILAAQDDRSCADIDALLQVADRSLDEGLVQRLVDRGYIAAVAPGEKRERIAMTPEGHRAAIELVAISKASEADLLDELDYNEAQLLKQLLRRMARRGAGKLPPVWRKS
jgi:3-hydroxy-9,10-secoandrosta-1,3,5(10)-triene-9,17-dione monooxygenase reductase component